MNHFFYIYYLFFQFYKWNLRSYLIFYYFEKKKTETYMTTIVSSDPMGTRWDTIKLLAVIGKTLEAKRIGLEHGIVSYAYRYHNFATCLNKMHTEVQVHTNLILQSSPTYWKWKWFLFGVCYIICNLEIKW